MKNTVLKLVVVLTVVFSLTSCNKDDSPVLEEGGSSYYKVYIDGTLFSEHTSDQNWGLINGMVAVGNENDFSLSITNVPAVGQTVDVSYVAWTLAADSGDTTEPMVVISGDNVEMNMMYMYSGTITRVSKYKITFTGIYKEDLLQGASHNFNGEVGVESIVEL